MAGGICRNVAGRVACAFGRLLSLQHCRYHSFLDRSSDSLQISISRIPLSLSSSSARNNNSPSLRHTAVRRNHIASASSRTAASAEETGQKETDTEVDEDDEDETEWTAEQRAWAGSFLIGDMPAEKFDIRYSRSGGAGGQNVNKVNTKVDLRFRLDEATWLPEFVRKRLRKHPSARINASGEVYVTSDKYRTQHQNRDDAIEKLHALLVEVGTLPEETSADTVARVAKHKEEALAIRKTTKTKHKNKKSSRRDFGE